jgi:cell division protein FtsB
MPPITPPRSRPGRESRGKPVSADAETGASAGRRLLHGLLLFITAVLVVNGLIGDKGLVETIRTRQERRALVASIERLRAENATLRDRARRLREDPATIEALAREQLGLIRPGEVLFIVKDARQTENQK